MHVLSQRQSVCVTMITVVVFTGFSSENRSLGIYFLFLVSEASLINSLAQLSQFVAYHVCDSFPEMVGIFLYLVYLSLFYFISKNLGLAGFIIQGGREQIINCLFSSNEEFLCFASSHIIVRQDTKIFKLESSNPPNFGIPSLVIKS